MKINGLALKDFRGFEDSILRFSEYTVLRGPNQAGKTTIMLGLSWVLTGANSLTSRDGKNWDHLIRRESTNHGMGVACSIEEFGQIERTRGLKSSHRLLIPDVEATAAASTQPILLDRLGIHPETLSVILDPKPFVTRDVGAQRDALTRTLRPPEIQVTELMKKYKVNAIQGVEHLGNLIKEFKEVQLRALNTEAKRLAGMSVSRPTWPFPGKDETDMRSAYDVALSKREELIGLIAKIEQQGASCAEQLKQADPEFDVLPQEEYKQKVERLAQQRQLVEQLDKKKKNIAGGVAEFATSVDVYAKEKTQIAFDSTRLKHTLESLQAPVECSAPACPVLATHFKKTGEQREKLQQEYDVLQGRFPDVVAFHKDAEEQLATKKTMEAEIGRQLRNAGQQVVGLQRAIEHHDAQAAAAAAYAKTRRSHTDLEKKIVELTSQSERATEDLRIVRGVISKADLAFKRVLEYHQGGDRATTYGQAVIKNSEDVAEIRKLIKGLENLKKKILGERIGEFLNLMQAFLQPFNLGELSYTWEGGFTINGFALAHESDGCALMMFEAAFRVAVATITEFRLVVLDQKAPLSRKNEMALAKQLISSKCQVIQTYTSDEPKAPSPDAKYTVLWVEKGTVQQLESEPVTV